MKVIALSRLFAERISGELKEPHAIISIGDPEPSRERGTGQAEFAENEYRIGLLRLDFYDIDVTSITNAGYVIEIQKALKEYEHGLFTDELANQILDFVEEMKDKVKVIVCHCEAGVSRSSGTAAAILRILTGSDDKIFNDPRYIPNIFVYRKILNAWEERRTQ